MDHGFGDIDALVSSIKGNTNFLNKLFFPKVSLFIVIGVISVAVVIRLILA